MSSRLLTLRVVVVGMLLTTSAVGGSSGSLIFPAYTDVIPCSDTAANCAQNYYGIQSSQQAGLTTTLNSAGSAQTSAAALLTLVQNLAAATQTLVNQIDPSNTITKGGQVLVLPTGTQLVGITPYMYTLSQQMVNAVSSRQSAMQTAVSTLQSGMNQITALLQSAASAANSQLLSTSNSIQQAITAQSVQLQGYFQQLDSKLLADASQFAASNSAAPNATAQSLTAAMALEAANFNSTMTKLNSLYSQMSLLPGTLQKYLQSLVTQLSAYQASQQTAATQQSAVAATAFSAQVAAAAASLNTNLQGILATSRSDPYYNSSLTGYIGLGQAALSASMTSANQSAQAQIDSLTSQIGQVAKSVSASFQPVLNAASAAVAQATAADTQFQAATQAAITDANATITSSTSSFKTFKTSMTSLWNTTGSVLSGQTTVITADLLNQIGNMTTEAGAEVDNLNALMQEASASALQTDAVRQSVLASSRSQVLSMIGSNAAGVNASIATIQAFLNSSQSQMSLLMNVLQSISGGKLGLLNSTANSTLSGIYKQIGLVANSSAGVLANLTKTVQVDVNSTQTASQTLFAGLKSAAQLDASQAAALIAAMQAANTDAIKKTNTQIASAQSLMDAASATSKSLAAVVGSIPTQSDARRAVEMNALAATVANATAALAQTQLAVQQQFTQLQQLVQQSAAAIAANQSGLVQNMSGALGNASTAFSTQSGSMVAQFQAMLAKINANATVAASLLNDMQAQLTRGSASVDTAYKAALAAASAAATNAVGNVKTTVDAYVSAMTSAVNAALANNVTAASAEVTKSSAALTSQMTLLEGQIAALTAQVNTFKNQPQALVTKASQLATQFNSQLQALQQSVLTLSASNDAAADAFAATVNATFGTGAVSPSSTDIGVQGELNQVNADIAKATADANATVNTGIGQIRQIVQTAAADVAARSNGFLSQIYVHRNATQAKLDAEVQNALAVMNTTFGGFQTKVNQLNASAFGQVSAAQSLAQRLAQLESDLAATQSDIANSNQSALMSKQVAAYGSSVATQIGAAMNASIAQLTQAQKSQIAQQQAAASLALSGAGGIAAVSTNITKSVQAAISQVAAQTALIQSNTAAVNTKLAAVTAAANATAVTAAAEVQAIIANYAKGANATKAAVAGQIAAAANSSVAVKNAMQTWSQLKQTALQVTQDELDELVATKASVFNATDSAIAAEQLKAQRDVSALSASVDKLNANITSVHTASGETIDSVLQQLDDLAARASNDKNGYENSITNLGGYVTTLVSELTNRYNSILAQTGPFRTALEAAAAQDIAALTV